MVFEKAPFFQRKPDKNAFIIATQQREVASWKTKNYCYDFMFVLCTTLSMYTIVYQVIKKRV